MTDIFPPIRVCIVGWWETVCSIDVECNACPRRAKWLNDVSIKHVCIGPIVVRDAVFVMAEIADECIYFSIDP